MFSFLEQIRFAQPAWLFLLLPTCLLVFRYGKKNAHFSVTFSSLGILSSLSKLLTPSPSRWTAFLLPCCLLLGIFALARPQWNEHLEHKETSGIDIVIALDVSYSMSIPDFNSKKTFAKRRRIEAAKEVITSFIKGRPNDRIGLVSFAGRPYSSSPITLDHSWVIKILQDLHLGTVREGGTAIGSAIAASSKRLHSRDSKSKIIILVTDGASNSGRLKPIDAAKLSAKIGIKIYTIALGTEHGRVHQGIQSAPQQEFDEKTLKEIAKITHAEYYRARNTTDLTNTFQSINALEKSTVHTHSQLIKKELFMYFLIPSFLFFALWTVFFSLKPTLDR